MLNLQAYLSIKEAATYLGVSQGTLRNWGRSGKLATYRNPLNGYRLYKKNVLEGILKTIEHTHQPRRQAALTKRGR